jgi:hypothetical protein
MKTVKVPQLSFTNPSPDKQDKWVNEVIFCQKIAENNF